MAPPTVNDDYYAILEMPQSATLEVITKSYKRLALKLHPDRNKRDDATAAFQLVSQMSYLGREAIGLLVNIAWPCLRDTQGCQPASGI